MGVNTKHTATLRRLAREMTPEQVQARINKLRHSVRNERVREVVIRDQESLTDYQEIQRYQREAARR